MAGRRRGSARARIGGVPNPDSPPAQSTASARLFLGLWPPEPVREALVRHAERWAWPRGARRVRPDKIHLTLHFIGDVPRERVAALAQAIAVPFEPIDLRLDHAEVWPGGIAVFGPSAVPAALLELHRRLGAALAAFGIAPERRALKAHVTLARRAQGAVAPPPADGVDWHADRYVLVESDRQPPTAYRVLASWP